jgi:hypothetical protein
LRPLAGQNEQDDYRSWASTALYKPTPEAYHARMFVSFVVLDSLLNV